MWARKGVNQWSTLNYNERNVIENGFLDQFKLAMRNLEANNRAAARAPAPSRTSAPAAARRAATHLSRLP